MAYCDITPGQFSALIKGQRILAIDVSENSNTVKILLENRSIISVYVNTDWHTDKLKGVSVEVEPGTSGWSLS